MCVEVLYQRCVVAADVYGSISGAAICSGSRPASMRSKSRPSRDFGDADRLVCHAVASFAPLNRPRAAPSIFWISPGPFACALILGRLFGSIGTSWNFSGYLSEGHTQIHHEASFLAVQRGNDARRASTHAVCNLPVNDLPLNIHPAAIRVSAGYDVLPDFGPPGTGIFRG